MLTTEIDIIKRENLELKRKINVLSYHKIDPLNISFAVINYKEERTFSICQQKGCRIMCIHPSNKLVLISKISENPNLFPGYGICKLSIDNLGQTNYCTEFVKLHKQRIRDLCVSTHDLSHLLSCSLDKSIRITNLNNIIPITQFGAAIGMTKIL
ncbi:hypothetical protein HZS_5075 [Henneguya salminicola]|nr:hypothetical protein HZS_5075 [Henneguya salminicola]